MEEEYQQTPPQSPVASTSGRKAKSKRKRGILGVPVKEKPMLFSFTSKELWPDEKSDNDSDSDEDYLPEGGTLSPVSKRQKKPSSSQLVELGSNSSNPELNGSTITNESQPSFAPLNDSPSTSISSSATENSFDTSSDKVKKRARKPRTAKTAKTRKASKTPRAKKSKSPKSTGQSRKSANLSKPSNTNETQTSTRTSFNDFNVLLRDVKIDFEQVLPPEILVKIFQVTLDLEQQYAQTLIKLSRVCENWRCLIISTPILWQRLDLEGFADDRFPLLNFQKLNVENELFTCVKELNLSGWSGVNAEKIINIVVESSNFDLELLNVKNCRNISSRFLDAVIVRCPNLKSIDISSITYFYGHNIAFFDSMQSRHGRGQQIALHKPLPPTKKTSSHQNCQNPFTTPIFKPFLESCGPKMVTLKMSENMMPSFPTCISIIMEFCHSLEVLDVSNVTSLGARSTSISVDKLQRSCPKLRILRAANINFTPTTCSAAAPPVPGFPALEELSIPFHESFVMPTSILDGNTDWTLELLTKGAENLKLLDIRGSRYISPRGLLKIPTWSMKYLSISNCTKLEDDTLEMVFTKWNKTLVDVDISWNKSERCINACIQALCDVDREESQLKSIQLRGSAISYEMLRKLVGACPQLTSIDVQSCRSLPRGIKRAFAGDEFTILRTELLEGKYE